MWRFLMHGDQNHNNSIKGSPELTLLRLWETSPKYVKTKVETKIEQSGTWLKASAEAAAKMVRTVVQHRPTESTTSPLPITNPIPALSQPPDHPSSHPKQWFLVKNLRYRIGNKTWHIPSSPYSSRLRIPNPNPRTISPDQTGFPLGTWWEHIGNKGKNKKSLSPHPLKKKEPGLFSKEFVTVFGPG
jgi:hypothetical protein